MNNKGKVFLVGAGPGDPDLITIKGKQILEKADVVLYDYLAHPNLLKYCTSSTQCHCVGKRKGKHSEKQSTINTLLLEHALAGKTVVRLKGGDPLIFGRGGEELAQLAKHNIPFEIIPGITSAIAVPAYAGIPLTHRELSRSVAFVTGTLKKGKTQLDIPVADTLVFLMAVTNINDIVKNILRCSRFTKTTPAAVIYHGTLAEQRTIKGTLATIVAQTEQSPLESPAMLVVGEVVNLSDTFQWKQKLPLSGKRFIICRTKEKAQEYASTLSEYGAEALIMPLIKIVPNKAEQQKITQSLLRPITTIIFTSSNGVSCFFESMHQKKLDARVLAQKKIIAVGPATAEACKKHGVIPDIIPQQHDAEGILAELSVKLPNEHILLPIATKARDILEKELTKRQASVQRIHLYDTQQPLVEAVPIYHNDYVIFTSTSTVDHFFNSGIYQNQSITALSIGAITTNALRAVFKGDILTAKTPTLAGLLDVLKEHT
ncbi:uroporphyrinogen-III C-methyltransferase [Candidatus Marinamargulisbacteria bacterium SCGC AG-414-C22]|nr:uroporphyrinogen-III C-methyltransferase [Candidatus Marinamargulisbacteria bacterium SCGC AG-414-C22]